MYELRVEGRAIYQSPLLRGPDAPLPIRVAIPRSATALSLIMNDGGDGNGHDHADWANARFRRAE